MRTYKLKVNGPTRFTTAHSNLSWALKYAELYRANWPTAHISLTSTVEVW